MDGKKQIAYPRKNWSSFMIFNCDHPDVIALTPAVVNTASSPASRTMPPAPGAKHLRQGHKRESYFFLQGAKP